MPSAMRGLRHPAAILLFFCFASHVLSAQTEFSDAITAPGFSHVGGFYTDGFTLTLSAPEENDVIIYTTDGSEPLPENLNGKVWTYKNSYPQSPGDPFGEFLYDTLRTYTYADPLEIIDRSPLPDRLSQKSSTYTLETPYFPDEPSFKGTVVRARICRAAEGCGPVKSHTFFVTPEGGSRYALPVISLALDEDGLYDYYDGIANAGVTFDEFRTDFPDMTYLPNWRSNWWRRGREWERETAFSLFLPETDGPALNHDTGLRLHGSSSRRWPRKSFRLYARSEYGASTFNHSFFGPGNDAAFKRIVLHNSGGDEGKANMRDAVVQRLLKPLNVCYLDAQPAVVFVNGEYYGINTIRERYDHHYFERKKGIAEENLEMYKDGNIEYGNEMHLNFVTAFVKNNPPTDENLEVFRTLVNHESLRDVFIVGIYSRNTDWLHNNTIAYRSKTDDGTNDLRWNIGLVDLDLGWANRNGTNAASVDFMHEILTDTINKGGDLATWWRWGMLNEGFRNDFINRTADLLNTVLLADEANAVITAYAAELAPYMEEHVARWKRPETYSEWINEISKMLDFNSLRPDFHKQHIENAFDLAGQFDLEVDVSDQEAGFIRVHSTDIRTGTPGVGDSAYPWTGKYFKGVPLKVTAVPNPGYSFAGWSDNSLSDSPAIEINTDAGSVQFTALFEVQGEAVTPEEEVFTYWHFNALPDDFVTVSSDFALGDPGNISYPGTGDGFMDDVNDGSDINLQFGEPAGRGLRVRNPSDTRELIIEAPTTGYSDIRLDYAARRTNNGATFTELYFRTSSGGPWIPLGSDSVFTEYSAYSFDLDGVAEANDNPDFAVRILFTDEAASNTSGNVRFDNISFSGLSLSPGPGPAHILAEGDFVFGSWAADEIPGSSPDFMSFWWSENPSDSAYDVFAPGISAYDCAYDKTNRPRINGLGEGGFSFITTGNPQYNNCNSGDADPDRYIGSASVTLNTTGVSQAEMSWVNRLVTEGARQFAVRLQYRIGGQGAFSDFDLSVTFSSADKSEGAAENFLIEFPEFLTEQEEVHLRWVYYQEEGDSGNRPEISVDDVLITTGSAANPILLASVTELGGFYRNEGQDPSGADSYMLTGNFLTPAAGTISVICPAPFEVSADGEEFSSQITVAYNGGSLDREIFVRLGSEGEAGFYSGLPLLHVGGNAAPVSVILSGEIGYPVNLAAGDVVVIGYRSVANDGIAFTNQVPIPDEAVLIFTDKGWTGTALKDNENALIWQNNTGAAIPAGTVVKIGGPEFGDGEGTDLGTILAGDMGGLSQNGDNIFIIQGGVKGPHWIYGLSYLSEWLTEGEVTNPTSYLPEALNIPFGNIVLHALNAEYNDTREGADSFAEYSPLIHDTNNWRKEDDGAAFGDFNTVPFTLDLPCNANGGTLTALSPVSLCAQTGEPQGVNIQLTGAVGQFGRYGLLDSDNNVLDVRAGNANFNLDVYPPGQYRIRHLRFEADVDAAQLAAITNAAQLADVAGCWSSSNTVNVFLSEEPAAGVLTPTSPTTVCEASGSQTVITTELTGASGFGSRFFLVSLSQPGSPVLASNSSGNFNLNPYGAGTYQVRHLSYAQGVNLSGVQSAADLQGCFSVSNGVNVSVVSCGAVITSSPNPTTGQSFVHFSNPREEYATLEVYDLSGRMLRRIFSQVTTPDLEYRLEFDGNYLPNGVYLYRLTTESETVIDKFMIAR